MATRNLATNTAAIDKTAQKIFKFSSTALEKSYEAALVDVRATIARLYDTFNVTGELTNAQRAQFLRVSNIEASIIATMEPYLDANTVLLQESSMLSFDQSYYRSAWSLDQATGVNLGWGQVSDTAVRAATGIGGDLADLTGYMPEAEVIQHEKIMTKAYHNYDIDSRKWIERDVRQGVIKGDTVVQLTKRLDQNSFMHSRNSAELIARTEILRSNGLGAQITYEQARDEGVNVIEIWDATLDDRTRPDHAAADGEPRNNETGLFSVPWGDVLGPRRSGDPAQDINCRCDVNPQIEGYAPEVRRIRGEGVVPYKSFRTWTGERGITRNRFGQEYSFT